MSKTVKKTCQKTVTVREGLLCTYIHVSFYKVKILGQFKMEVIKIKCLKRAVKVF